MEVRYYPDTDTAYLYLLEPGERAKVDESEEVAPGVIVDFDGEDRPVGVEIYEGARAKLAGLPPSADAAERIRREERERIRTMLQGRLAEMESHVAESARAVSALLAEEGSSRRARETESA